MGRKNYDVLGQDGKASSSNQLGPVDVEDESGDCAFHQQCMLPPALSKEQAMKYWGYTDSALKMRRHRHWKEGTHYGKEPGGAIVYYREEIDRWRRYGNTAKG